MKNRFPIPIAVCSPSALVPHSPDENVALDASPRDYGLKPNGVTIEMMQENPEFYQKCDDLDRPAYAAQASAKCSEDVKKVVRAIKSAERDRNKPKNVL